MRFIHALDHRVGIFTDRHDLIVCHFFKGTIHLFGRLVNLLINRILNPCLRILESPVNDSL